MRRAICGAPNTGKTTLAGETARHTDDLIGTLDWSDASAEVATWFDDPNPDLCVEGVSVPRALRKWLAAHPEGKPVDELLVLRIVYEPVTKGQATMTKAHDTVLREILPELDRRGVVVTLAYPPERDQRDDDATPERPHTSEDAIGDPEE